MAEPVTLSATGEPVQSATVTSPLSPVTSPLYSRASDTEEGKSAFASFLNFPLFWVLQSSLSTRWHHQISPFPFRHLIFYLSFPLLITTLVSIDFSYVAVILWWRSSSQQSTRSASGCQKSTARGSCSSATSSGRRLVLFLDSISMDLLFLFILFICCVCYGSPRSLCSSRWTVF